MSRKQFSSQLIPAFLDYMEAICYARIRSRQQSVFRRSCRRRQRPDGNTRAVNYIRPPAPPNFITPGSAMRRDVRKSRYLISFSLFCERVPLLSPAPPAPLSLALSQSLPCSPALSLGRSFTVCAAYEYAKRTHHVGRLPQPPSPHSYKSNFYEMIYETVPNNAPPCRCIVVLFFALM